MLTIDVTGMPAELVTFAASPLAELTSMLHVLAEPAHHPALQPWVAATLAGLKPELADRLLEAEFLWRSSRADFLVPARPGASLAEELDEVDRIPDDVYVAAALVTTCGSSRLSFRRAVVAPSPPTGGAGPAAGGAESRRAAFSTVGRGAGFGRGVSPLVDAGAAERAVELAMARGPRQAAFAERLLTDPAAVRAVVRRLLEDCADAFFADAWRRVEHRLAADARHKAEIFARLGLAAALEAVSPAASLAEQGGAREIRLDKLQDNWTGGSEGVTFIPSVYNRPHLLTVHAPGWRPVVQYPAADRHDAAPLALDVVRRRVEALAHPVRLRLCRTLARGPHTTGELAEAWELSAPEVSRHLAVLRKAGLIVTTRRGRYGSHALDITATASLGADLLAAFLR